ncbi:MAG: ubiquitin carboxyl-terminal hydrolase [Cytophagales bacterium]|nr:ubiquitin carboxyl-terminal hydrolase [Cytophagales bacterium]
MVEAKNKWAKSTIQKLLLLSKVALLLFACGKRATIHTNLTPDKSDREASKTIGIPTDGKASSDVDSSKGSSAIGTPVTGEAISFPDTTDEGSTTPKAASSAISTPPCGEAIIDVDSSKGNSAIDASNATSVDGKAINADSSEDGKGSSTPKASSATCSDLNKDNRMPGGMANAGNTCYVAATMQALAVVYDKTFSTIDTSSWTDERKAVAGAIEKVIRQIRGGQPVNYNGMKKFLQTLVENNWYPGGRQQDAEELLSFIFNIFGLNPPIKVASIISPIERDEAVPDSPKIEPSFILPLEIPEENKDSLDIQDCLLAFFKREEVDYKYEESGCWSKAYKKLRLTDDLPTIMAIQLKRFKQEWKVGKVIKQKIENSVNTPLFLTIPAACMNDGQASHAYNLVAFVVHIGKTLDFGHYIAYVKRVDKWFRCNDSWVGKVTESDASKEAKKAYVYFYQKQ